VSASTVRACRPSSAASWCPPKKWSSSRTAWHLVKHTSKVTGFVGGARNRPAPISEAEVMKIVNQMQEGIDKPRPKVLWQVGELVRVKDGPFTDFNGAVEEVNYEKSKVRVSVTIFGRATPVELVFAQVEKV
jgi:transcriptional antiterminator NusG